MRRRAVAGLVVATTMIAVLGLTQPASATHNCTQQSCNPVTVAVLEGIGFVCNAADVPNETGEKCTYTTDAFHPNAPRPNQTQGLTWPGFGPPARGPFSFNAGPAQTPPTSACVSSINGAGCSFKSWGLLTVGDAVGGGGPGFGAYCGASRGVGESIFNSGGMNPVTTRASFGWRQSAATILPLEGRVSSSTPAGGVGATVVGFTSSRGTANGGNCGITQVTTAFNVEGMIVTF